MLNSGRLTLYFVTTQVSFTCAPQEALGYSPVSLRSFRFLDKLEMTRLLSSYYVQDLKQKKLETHLQLTIQSQFG